MGWKYLTTCGLYPVNLCMGSCQPKQVLHHIRCPRSLEEAVRDFCIWMYVKQSLPFPRKVVYYVMPVLLDFVCISSKIVVMFDEEIILFSPFNQSPFIVIKTNGYNILSKRAS